MPVRLPPLSPSSPTTDAAPVATTQWRRVAPFRDSNNKFIIITVNLERISRSDLHYYALIYSAVPYFIFASQGAAGFLSIPPSWLAIKGKVLRLLRDDLASSSEATMPDYIFSILASLSSQEINYETLQIHPPAYPRSPLGDYQCLASAGYRAVEVHHAAFLYRTVLQRGGLKNISPRATRYVLALGDLLLATTHLLPPAYALLWTPDPKITAGLFPFDEAATALSAVFAAQFGYMSCTSWASIKPFLNLLPLIKNTTIALDAHRRRASGSSDVAPLIACANVVQHRLLRLGWDGGEVGGSHGTVADVFLRPERAGAVRRTFVASGTSTLSDTNSNSNSVCGTNSTLQILRLASLIFSDLTLFPMSFASRIRLACSIRLHTLLSHPNSAGSIPEPNLEMYVLCMGALGCMPLSSLESNSQKQVARWFLGRLKGMVDFICGGGNNGRVKGESREDGKKERFLNIMRGFLWWEYVMSRPMGEVWAEMYPDEDGNR